MTAAKNEKLFGDSRIMAAIDEARARGEEGISVAAYFKNKLIVDSFGGLADPGQGKPVQQDTIFAVFSVTKGIIALAAQIQVERGLLDVHAPVARYWPEFAANGKQNITVEQCLSHRAGIPQMPRGVTPQLMADWDWMVSQIADMTPIFPAGKTNAYHVLSWGWIVGEIVRRTDPKKRSLRAFVTEEILEPLGISNEVFLGVPDSELARIALLSGGQGSPLDDDLNTSPTAVFPAADAHNLREVQQAVHPGAGAICTARGMARIFAVLANGGELDGVRLLSRTRTATLTEPREDADAPDKIIPIPVWCGKAGYFLGGKPGASCPLLPDHPDVLYSPGAGGSYAWADLRGQVAIALCHNNMDTAMIVEPELTYAPIVRAIMEVVKEHQAAEAEAV